MLLAGRNAWQNVCAQVISGQTSVSSVSGGLQRKASWYNYDVMSVLCLCWICIKVEMVVNM